MFSQRGERYEIRKLSNTYNANVIFSVKLNEYASGLTDQEFITALIWSEVRIRSLAEPFQSQCRSAVAHRSQQNFRIVYMPGWNLGRACKNPEIPWFWHIPGDGVCVFCHESGIRLSWQKYRLHRQIGWWQCLLYCRYVRPDHLCSRCRALSVCCCNWYRQRR